MASSSIPLPITDYTGMSLHSGLSLAIKLQPHFSLATPVALYPHFYSKASHLGIGVMSILFYSKCSKIYIPLYFYFACSGFVFCLPMKSHCATKAEHKLLSSNDCLHQHLEQLVPGAYCHTQPKIYRRLLSLCAWVRSSAKSLKSYAYVRISQLEVKRADFFLGRRGSSRRGITV